MFDTRTVNFEDGTKIDLQWQKADRVCFQYILQDWNNFYPTIMKYVKGRDSVFQAGGNCGLYPLLYSGQFKTVYTFEPDPLNFACLAANCINPAIVKFNAAIGAEPGFLKIGIVDPGNVGMNKISDQGAPVYCVTIDSLGIEQLDLLHLDLEGYEYPALQGAKETIARCKPVVVAEGGDGNRAFPTLESIMDSYGYDLVESYHNSPVNYIFMPRD